MRAELACLQQTTIEARSLQLPPTLLKQTCNDSAPRRSYAIEVRTRGTAVAQSDDGMHAAEASAESFSMS